VEDSVLDGRYPAEHDGRPRLAVEVYRADLAGAFLAAILATYFIERPAAKWILRPRSHEEREPLLSVCCEELPQDNAEAGEQDEKDNHEQ
jgi:peptidoglycan/LPS O-acetylase OafA/YrhL